MYFRTEADRIVHKELWKTWLYS